MNINDIYSESAYVIAHKETGETLFGTRLFDKPRDAKLAWNNAASFRNCRIYKIEQYRNKKFDEQDEYEIVEVTNTIHIKIGGTGV